MWKEKHMENKLEVLKSIQAITQYIAKDNKKAERHRANIIIHTNGRDYGPGIRTVSATVTAKTGQVIIENLHTIYGGCSNILTTENAIFTLVSNTLCIKTSNTIGGDISINIT